METNTLSDVKIEKNSKLRISKRKLLYYSLLFFFVLTVSVVVGYLTVCNSNSNTKTNTPTPPSEQKEIPIERNQGTFNDYPLIVLDESAKGKIRIEQYYDQTIYDRQYPYSGDSRIYFLFDSEKDNTTYALTENLYKYYYDKENRLISNEIYTPLLVNKDIYFMYGFYPGFPYLAVIGMPYPEIDLMKYNIETGMITTIKLNLEKDNYLCSFYIDNNTIYYLTFDKEFVVNLYSHNLGTKETKNLASGIDSEKISGMNIDKDKIYLSSHNADVYMEEGSYQEYDLTTGILKYLGYYSIFHDIKNPENIDEEGLEEFKSITKDIDWMEIVDYLLIDNNTISFPAQIENSIEDEEEDHNIGIKVFTE